MTALNVENVELDLKVARSEMNYSLESSFAV